MSVDPHAAAAATGAASAPALPRLLLLTDRHQARRPLVEVVAAAVDHGVRAVVVREKDLGGDERAAIAAALAPVVHGAGGILLAAGEHLPGTDGVHLPATAATTQPPRRPPGGTVGRSCHDREELRRAEAQGADYVTVSPVFPTASKPGYGPVLDAGGVADLAAATPLPVYALGGVDSPARVRRCREAGAHGVAVMGAAMRAPLPGRVVADLLATAEDDR